MFAYSSVEQYHARLQDGATSCVQAVKHYLDQISRCQQLNAFITVYEAEALERAAALDQSRQAGESMGPLHGVVIGIKDVISHKDHALSAASNILKGFSAIYSATAVERLLAAGAIIIGSLNCDEFAMGSTNEHSAYGKVLNALD
ncbi:MAG: Asp-tRNA(Asn)/Glu-tRNA(Gln) amidotransferase subunit GatA, partial [Chitinophagaceae bacterium]|nr:Asp-tRNA(Asn)/Glu-tRNA(Gln) amidotransferase subunit GatA [Chitinophagaceae bacterium]